MTEQPKPSEAAIREACKRTGFTSVQSVLVNRYCFPTMLALAAMIEKYEPETLVDRDLIRAREIALTRYAWDRDRTLSGAYDDNGIIQCMLHAIKETRAEYEK